MLCEVRYENEDDDDNDDGDDGDDNGDNSESWHKLNPFYLVDTVLSTLDPLLDLILTFIMC